MTFLFQTVLIWEIMNPVSTTAIIGFYLSFSVKNIFHQTTFFSSYYTQNERIVHDIKKTSVSILIREKAFFFRKLLPVEHLADYLTILFFSQSSCLNQINPEEIFSYLYNLYSVSIFDCGTPFAFQIVH